ncbi:class I SAM-dependent methyltransferase [Burkholderia cepacia]|uniref:class I SAM-dependent methyltransferase n=1 Tax=Burkholderia cepacia TaxID=292 RepID=UPI001CF3F708|nr:class I SAM-dependent methyltransferase [Burkholderia cepacia]MCA7941159.1 class I SAM-dependent methyltransferase [Burkholderia cepacia]HEM7893898.1 class I SAM-dependent methyltransferase [Burkholderia cepacia]HEM8514345.1 class I SAM-dependent methyltransferase [Burkholderia cepacia]
MEQIGYSWPTFDQLTQHLVKSINPGRILDVGAGGGKYGRLLRKIVPDCRFTALECDEETHPFLIENGYDDIISGVSDTLYERSGDSYDTIILGDVIEHMRHSHGRDLLEFLNYRSRYIIISPPECMPMSSASYFESHNSVWRPDSFMWHDFWAHQQCGIMHFYLLRGHLDWNAPRLDSLVNSANASSLFNTRASNEHEAADEKFLQPVNLTLHDSRYLEKLDGDQYTVFRPI